ncbi:MAG: hypothetical protein HYZ29_34400 [Myxococcales bacterium]|nr:hypothetical protein [Myxococcales bacterium]
MTGLLMPTESMSRGQGEMLSQLSVAEGLAAWKGVCGDVAPDDRVFTDKGRFGTHGFPRSSVTRSLAVGMAEDWLRARSGYKSMELLRYRLSAKGLADPGVPEVDPRPHAKVAELADALA